MQKGFTLVELLVTIAIIGILSSIILFSTTQYINKSRDTNVIGNLAILVSSGEVWYNGHQSYADFCTSSVVTNAINEIPKPASPNCITGICCIATSDAWVACAQLFTYNTKAYCIDSRGVKKQIDNSVCLTLNSASPKCP